MTFFSSTIDALQSLVISLGAALGAWGGSTFREGYGNAIPAAQTEAAKQPRAGGGGAPPRRGARSVSPVGPDRDPPPPAGPPATPSSSRPMWGS